MKKTVTVSLGGMVFCLEDDAYIKLDTYLKRLEGNFTNEPDRREIMNDIESRIAEHLKEKAPTSENVININEVNRVIGIMGDPSDFGEENASSQSARASFRHTRKRLYRDPDNKVLGGVSSGLGYYWNIDPVIIRILFVFAALWGGGILVYIILWIAIPEALTAAERLEMTGDPVTAENIGRSFHGSREQYKSKNY
jgi:phage shock protein PspC (stress-responsive transcriptional regulator)